MSDTAWFWWIVLTGPIAGSLLGLLTVRLPRGEPIGMTRSACRACGRALAPLELIPLVSWLVQRGRCRSCRAPVSVRYPLLELACLAIGLWAAMTTPGPAGFVTAALGWSLLLIATLDAEHFWLPDALTLPLLAAGLVQAALAAPDQLQDRALGAAIGFVSLALIAWIYRRVRGRDGLGGGDPRLYAAAGAWVGWAGLPSVLLWASAGAFSVLAARALVRRDVAADTRVPLGAYLALGLWLTWLYGPLGLG